VLELTYTAWDLQPFADDVWSDADEVLRQAMAAQWEENTRATGGHGDARPPDWLAVQREFLGRWAEVDAKGGTEGASADSAASGGAGGPQRRSGGKRASSGSSEPFPYPPFKWAAERRGVLQAELDAIYARLYGLTERELRYVLDPTDVYGEDFPGETFRVLKEKEMKTYGEYRTKRLVLEAWARLGGAP